MMRNVIIIFISLILLTSCRGAPSYVIQEEEMAALLIDLQKGETVVEIQSGSYYNDSLKKRLKQSIFIKHGVTQEEFDTSIVWYAHNIDKYILVYDNVIKGLEREDKEIAAAAKLAGASTPMAIGDSVNLWSQESVRVFKNNMLPAQLSLKLDADEGFKKGDRFQWAFKMLNNKSSIEVFLGIDYKDGSSSYIIKKSDTEGWNRFSIQADSTRVPRRIFGYVDYEKFNKNDAIFFDSIEFVRTRLSADKYSFFYTQKTVQKRNQK